SPGAAGETLTSESQRRKEVLRFFALAPASALGNNGGITTNHSNWATRGATPRPACRPKNTEVKVLATRCRSRLLCVASGILMLAGGVLARDQAPAKRPPSALTPLQKKVNVAIDRGVAYLETVMGT